MNLQEAKNLIVKTFENKFDEPQFVYFIRNLLNNLDESEHVAKRFSGNLIPASYSETIKSYKRIGQYSDSKNNIIDVLVVNLKKETTLERARTLQRNFIARHLKHRTHEAALVAFYTEEYSDWRFSLVKMDLNINKAKIEIDLSPAKRYSFLVGANERSHTAQSQFQKILTENPNPTLDELEQAFNIETVTKEFFLEYRNLFIHTKQELDEVLKSDPKVKSEFASKRVNSVDFSKKLLGQIIFLYFLQKKGWFGVERDSDWGTGSTKFLRELFEKKHGGYNNFFNDILEPLFYEALRIDRSHDDHYYSRFNCKIPFLNGGLFDPINNYDWVHTDINLPNALFSNKHKTKEGDLGDGILDIFDRYNFTVIEDEPLEKEVAIDPELLGKAYEKFNAIRPDNFNEYIKVLKSGKKGEENKFNKQYGVYYTPREIVHYMCRESLINYLSSIFSKKADAYQQIDLEQLDAFGNTERKGQLPLETEYKTYPYIPKEDIETLINYGELLGENEAIVESKGKETDTYYHKLPASIRQNAKLIDEKLSDVLICDPAVGSGAFPVGMMHEIVSTRNLLSIFISPLNKGGTHGGSRTIYNFKRKCIEKSLYGVDIDSGAVEIAKLRLWLSLVVDENDINNIKPLPNLDYKIICGNSLLNYPYKPLGLDEIERLKQEFISETNPAKKNQLREKIDSSIYGLYNNSEKNLGYKVTMDFKINFSEVFHLKNGFDIVIGNPPYLESRSPDFTDKLKEDIQTSVKTLWNSDSKYITRGSDLLIYFFERGLTLVSPNGWMVLITQNAWLDTDYGKLFQDFLVRHTQVKKIIDSDFKHFDSKDGPNINTVITVFEGNKTNSSNVINFINYSITNNYIEIPTATKIYSYEDSFLAQYKWGILLKSQKSFLDILRNINSYGKRLDELSHLKLSLGQGLNLSKDYFVKKDYVEENSLLKIAIPILTSADGAPFIISKTSKYLLPSSCRSSLKKNSKIFFFDKKSTSKNPPLFILPRGIGRHFCAYNNIHSYSASFVEIYINEGSISKADILRLWLFFNSSLFWLIRELSGRKNLGGGMLKAEATDLKCFPLYFQFNDIDAIEKLFNHLSDKDALSPIEEIKSQHHQQIDRFVFNYLNIKKEQQKEIIDSLKHQILTRSKKSKT